MRKNSLKQNFMYNISYQILTMIMPFITTPYIARVVGVTGTGIYSYTYSIVQYFVLFAMLGINNYGNRLVAKTRDDKNKMSREFSSLFSVHIFVSLIILILYFIYVFFIGEKNYLNFFLIQTIYIISCLLDINWLFFGLEEFKITITRNIVIKILSACCIFLFVKSANDLNLYMIIMATTSLLSNILLFPFIKKLGVKITICSFNDLKKHFIPLCTLFIPVIAISVYKLMDKIMIGNIINVTEVGYYEYAEKIINMPLALITALGTVMLPRMSNLAEKRNEIEMKKYINKSIKFTLFFSIPISFGIIIISKTFIILFLGINYIESIILTQILSFTIPIVSWANIIRTQYLLPKEKDNVYIISVIVGALINFIFNMLLIPMYNAIGAAIATLITEFIVMAYQTYYVRKNLPIVDYFKDIVNFLIKSLVMSLIVIYTSSIIENNIVRLIFQVLIGSITYIIINYNYIFNELNCKLLVKKILKINSV